jgi:hypothetical protein
MTIKKSYLGLLLLTALTTIPATSTSLTIALDQSTLAGVPGSAVEFFGVITNTTASAIFLNGDSYTVLGLASGSLDDSPFFNNAPLSLAAGASSLDIGLFTINIPGNTVPALYSGSSFNILGGAGSGDQNLEGTATFNVNRFLRGICSELTLLLLRRRPRLGRDSRALLRFTGNSSKRGSPSFGASRSPTVTIQRLSRGMSLARERFLRSALSP